jgi:predicted HTH domain antitoxin
MHKDKVVMYTNKVDEEEHEVANEQTEEKAS